MGYDELDFQLVKVAVDEIELCKFVFSRYLGCKQNNGVKQLHGYGEDVGWFVTFLCFLCNPSVLVFVIVLVLM
jgi:hypothetical protein